MDGSVECNVSQHGTAAFVSTGSNASNASAEGSMTKLLDFVMLICAIIGSMAFGVLGAYGMFRLFFALMRPRRARATAQKPATEPAL